MLVQDNGLSISRNRKSKAASQRFRTPDIPRNGFLGFPRENRVLDMGHGLAMHRLLLNALAVDEVFGVGSQEEHVTGGDRDVPLTASVQLSWGRFGRLRVKTERFCPVLVPCFLVP